MTETNLIEFFCQPMNFVQGIILLILSIGLYWLIAYFRKSGSNAADKNDMRDLSYEGKKGGNVADDEDSVSRQQRERLIRILYLAEKINQSQNKYQLYFYDITSRVKFDQLIEDLNSLLTELYHEQRLANLYIREDEKKVLDDMVLNASGVVAEMSTNSTNAASILSTYNLYMNRSVKDLQSEHFYLKEALNSQSKFEKMRLKKLLLADDYQNAIQKYADWLGEYLKQNIRVMS